MKHAIAFILLGCIVNMVQGQESPVYVDDYKELIGSSQCYSLNANPDGTWKDTVNAVWRFKTILGGTAIQDETFKDDGTYTSSIRQFHVDSSQWVVTYFTTSTVPFNAPEWIGSAREGNQMVLYRPQKAPNGFPGYSRLKFYDISDQGFNWIGEWVSEDETIIFPFWKIGCKKIAEPTDP